MDRSRLYSQSISIRSKFRCARIYDVPVNDNTNFSRSLKRIKAGINRSQVTQPHSTLGGSFPYEPGDSVHFLGPKGRIGLGCIADIYGGEHRLVHSGTWSTLLFGDYMSPTNKTRRAHAQSPQSSSPILKVSFKLGTQVFRSKRSGHCWKVLSFTDQFWYLNFF